MWTRNQTKEWIAQLENRIEDIDYYLNETVRWCETYGVWDDQKVFTLSFMAILWVAHMRNEEITKRELLEILGIKDWESAEDLIYELNGPIKNADFEEMLEIVLNRFDDE